MSFLLHHQITYNDIITYIDINIYYDIYYDIIWIPIYPIYTLYIYTYYDIIWIPVACATSRGTCRLFKRHHGAAPTERNACLRTAAQTMGHWKPTGSLNALFHRSTYSNMPKSGTGPLAHVCRYHVGSFIHVLKNAILKLPQRGT